jgi:prophage tail gpP-like protein
MSNIQGKNYTVVSGDTLSSIAQKAYGDATKWTIIWKANQDSKKNTDPDTVFPGQIFFIPFDPDTERSSIESIKTAMTGKSADDLTVVVGMTELKPLSARIVKNMDNGVFGWSVNVGWTPGQDLDLDNNLLPFKYPKASIFIGKTLLVNGFLYGSDPSLINRGRIVQISGYSLMADVHDSTLRPPYEENNVTLVNRIKTVLSAFGMSLEVQNGLDTGGPFRRVTASATEKAFQHLSSLCAQRGVLLTSTPEGAALLTQADTKTKSVGTISEGEHGAQEFAGIFDGRKVFSTYKAIGQSPGFFSKSGISKDKNIVRSRFMTFVADETIGGEMQKLADWRRSKQFAEAMKNRLPVEGWYAPNGELWRENTKVTLVSKTLHIPNGFDFLIKQVEFVLDGSGRRTELTLVPPQVYTGEEIGYPWSN